MSNIINLFDNWLNKSRSDSNSATTPTINPDSHDDLHELNHLQEIIFKISGTGKWLYLSDKWSETTGYKSEECLGKSWLSNIHPQDHDACQGYIRRASKGHPDTLATYIRIITNQNELRWMEMRASMLPSGIANNFNLIGTLTDISAEKADNERQLANYRALSSLVSNIPGMVYRCRNNRDWTMEFVSSGCLELTGYNSELVINNTTAWNDIIHPEAREYVWMTIQTAVQNQQPFDLTYRIITREGDEKWVWERGCGNYADNGELLGLEGLITDITDNKRQSLRIERDSLFDPVTKLATQHLFFNRIQHAIELAEDEPDHSFCVVMLHISQHSNAANGLDAHERDMLAKEIGKRLKSILKASATVCRLREDEFGILLELYASDSTYWVNRILRSLQACLKAPLKLGEHVIYVKASIGAAMYANHGNNSEILQDANRAMTQARELGGSKIEFSNPQHNSDMATILGSESELKNALEEGNLELVCQPLRATKSTHTLPKAMELKIAWHHPRRGTLYADNFYGHIQDPELIRLLGKLIVNSINQQLSEKLQHEAPSEVYIHGLSEQILSAEVTQEVVERLCDPIFNSISFIVEIEAKQLANADSNSLKNLEHLKTKGINIAVTDLTAGSPYADMLSLPGIKAIKIHVTESAHDMAQCRATMAYYSSLNIAVIAEGVDTPEINHAIEGAAIDYLQGTEVSETDPQGND